MSVEAAERYVAAGAALLDEKRDDNWRATLHAHREELELASTSRCVLGWLYGDYFTGKETLGFYDEGGSLYGSEPWEYGFEHSLDVSFDETRTASYSELKNAWLDEIEPSVHDNTSMLPE